MTKKNNKLTLNKKLTFSFLILALAIYDTLFLLTISINKGTTTYYNIRPYYNFKIYPVTNSIRQLTFTGGIYMIVALSFERYVTYCHPEKAKWLCTRTVAKIVVILLTVFSLLCTIPVFLEHEWDLDGNAQEASIRSNPFYEKGIRAWMNSVIRFFTPTLCLVIFNYQIIKKVRNKWLIERFVKQNLEFIVGSVNHLIHIQFLPPVDLHLIFERRISKNGFPQTPFLVNFKLDFYCLCSLQNSSLN